MGVDTKEQDIHRIYVIIAWLAAAVAVIVTLVFFAWWATKDTLPFNDQPFDQITWITASKNLASTCQRGDMTKDLVQHQLPTGMMREAVTGLLGRPTWEDETHMEYELGHCNDVHPSLRIFFSDQHQLSNSRIVQH